MARSSSASRRKRRGSLLRRDTTVNEDTLPIKNNDPLVPRVEWQCKFRDIMGTDVRPGVQFCDGSFDGSPGSSVPALHSTGN